MTYEMMVGLTVTDDALYTQYRAAMAPLLAAHGGGFRYDFTIANVLKSASEHPINRVFAIYFGSKAQMDTFFAHPDYQAIKARFFQRSVAGTTIFGGYERGLPHSRHSAPVQRLELFDVVRIARLDVADRPYGDSGGSMRAPRLGDEGTVVWVDEEGPARGRALVECVADDGMTIWLADFAEHELELVARGVEVGKPKRRSVRRASLWLLAAIAVMATAWIGFVTIDHRQGLFVLPMVGALAGLTVFLAALLDLGKALVELPAPTRLQRALGLVLRAPLAVLGLFCVLTAIAIVVYGVHAIVSGATNDLRMGLLLPVVLGSFGLRWLRQAFHRQPGVAPKERGSTSPRR